MPKQQSHTLQDKFNFFFPPFCVLIFSPPTANTKTVGQRQQKPLLTWA